MAQSRPTSLVLACGYAFFGAIALFWTSWAALRSPKGSSVHAELSTFFHQVGITTDLDAALHYTLIGLLAISLAAFVLAAYTFAGDNSARIGLTILGALSALGFLITGLFGSVAAIIAALAVGLLWTPAVRLWFQRGKEEQPVQLGVTPAVPNAFASAPFAQTGNAPASAEASADASPEEANRSLPTDAAAVVRVALTAALLAVFGIALTLVDQLRSKEQIIAKYSDDVFKKFFEMAQITPEQVYWVMIAMMGAVGVVSILLLASLLVALKVPRVARTVLIVGGAVAVATSVPMLPLSAPFTAAAIWVLVKASSPTFGQPTPR